VLACRYDETEGNSRLVIEWPVGELMRDILRVAMVAWSRGAKSSADLMLRMPSWVPEFLR
jgi:hypothetical protein